MDSTQEDSDHEAQLEALEAAQAELDWWEAWDLAWDALEAQGRVDGLGGMEYRRLSAEARYLNLYPSQANLREWISGRTNAGPVDSITAASLRAREDWRRSHTEG